MINDPKGCNGSQHHDHVEVHDPNVIGVERRGMLSSTDLTTEDILALERVLKTKISENCTRLQIDLDWSQPSPVRIIEERFAGDFEPVD